MRVPFIRNFPFRKPSGCSGSASEEVGTPVIPIINCSNTKPTFFFFLYQGAVQTNDWWFNGEDAARSKIKEGRDKSQVARIESHSQSERWDVLPEVREELITTIFL